MCRMEVLTGRRSQSWGRVWGCCGEVSTELGVAGPWHCALVSSPHVTQRTLHTVKGLWGPAKGGETGAGGRAQSQERRREGEAHSPQNHHVEWVVGDAGYEGHEGDEEDGWEQEVGTGDGA